MKIAIPVSTHDKHLIPDLTACLLKMGGLEEHPVIFFPTPSAKEAAFEAAEKLGAQTHVLEHDFEGGAPIACNNHFAAVVYALAKMGNTGSFLWMEADMLPVAPRWADTLQNEYRMLGQPFMGNIVETPFDENGRLVFRDNDTMMMGCGVYPANMERDERIKPMLSDLAKTGMRNPRVPFDVYLRWAIKRIGCANTKLICDMWATRNYRMTAEGIVCESVDHGDRVVRKRGGSIPKQSVLVHGCKDGSLAGIVTGTKMLIEGREGAGKFDGMAQIKSALEKQGHVVNEIKSPEPAAQPESIPASPPEDAFWGDESTPAPIPVTAPTPKQHTVTPVEYVPPVVKTIPDAVKKKTDDPAPPAKVITRADIEKAMDGKKMRLTELAKKLGVDSSYLAGTFSRNGYEVLTAGWVRSTIQITKD